MRNKIGREECPGCHKKFKSLAVHRGRTGCEPITPLRIAVPQKAQPQSLERLVDDYWTSLPLSKKLTVLADGA